MSIDILPSASDVIAMRVHGKLEHEELQRVIDLTERSLADHEKTHMFIEAVGFRGVETQHLAEYFRRSLPLLGKLKRFGRIAVVTDQTWLRVAAKVESALLPNISYETFELSEREHALAWVEGREPRPRPTGIRVVETNMPDVFAFEIDGKLTEHDLETVAKRFMDQRPPRVIGKVIRLGGSELGGLFDADFVTMKLAALSSVERYAIVGGPAWLAGWVSIAGGLARADVRHFAIEDEAAAWEWISAQAHSAGQAPA